MDTIGNVYLIHLDKPLAHARHYVGFAYFPLRRFSHHLNGSGSRMLAACIERGITFRLARVWRKRTRRFERRMKKRAFGSLQQYCKFCVATPQRTLRRRTK